MIPTIPFASGFTWFQLLPGIGDGGLGRMLGLHDPGESWIIATAWFACFLVLGVALLARMGLNRAIAAEGAERHIPDSGFSVRNVMEVFVEAFQDLVTGLLGAKEAKVFFPLVAGCFLFIATSNLLGLLPGFLPATESFSNNLGMGVTIFLVFNYAGLTRNGLAYVKHLFGPVLLLAWLIFPIELLGLFIRPFTLTIRLTANIYADHMVVSSVRDVGGDMLGMVGALLVPVPFYVLGLFVCLLQAFVFSLLSTVYVSLSTADMSHGHDDNDHDGKHAGDGKHAHAHH